MRRLMAATLCGAVALSSSVAMAGPPPEGAAKPDKPWGRGVFSVGGGLGGSFYGDSGGSLSFGVGAEYFVWHGIGLGLGYTNLFYFLSNSLKRDFPGVEDRVPTYYGFLSPTLRVFLFRSYRFSPYVLAGTGPVFLNNNQPTLGRWEAGGGFYIGLGPRAAIDIGLGVSQLYTGSACKRATTEVFTAAETGFSGDVRVDTGACGIGFFPRIGIVFGFGGNSERKSRRERQKDKQMEGFEAPEAAPQEGEAEPEFAPAPEEEPAPTPVEESRGWDAPAVPDAEAPPADDAVAPVGETPAPPAEGSSDAPVDGSAADPAPSPVEEPADPSTPPVQQPTPL